MKYSITADSPFGAKRIHPLTRVSRELRAETLALAWLDVQVESEPSASILRLYNSVQFSSRYACRFHQLDAFERSNRVSRARPTRAFFPARDKRRLQICGILFVDVSSSSSVEVIFYSASRYSTMLDPFAMRKTQSHLGLASRLFSSSYSPTAQVVMALLRAPSLWEQSNLACKWQQTKPTSRKKPRVGDAR